MIPPPVVGFYDVEMPKSPRYFLSTARIFHFAAVMMPYDAAFHRRCVIGDDDDVMQCMRYYTSLFSVLRSLRVSKWFRFRVL